MLGEQRLCPLALPEEDDQVLVVGHLGVGDILYIVDAPLQRVLEDTHQVLEIVAGTGAHLPVVYRCSSRGRRASPYFGDEHSVRSARSAAR